MTVDEMTVAQMTGSDNQMCCQYKVRFHKLKTVHMTQALDE